MSTNSRREARIVSRQRYQDLAIGFFILRPHVGDGNHYAIMDGQFFARTAISDFWTLIFSLR